MEFLRPPDTSQMQHFLQQRVRRCAVLVGWLIACSEAVAHPTTHVDAWAKTGDTLDVRIVVVLHDVLGYQSVSSRADDLIPADQISSAIDGFGRTLLDRLQVYDESGRRMSGTVHRPPRWKPDPNGVRLSTHSTLRLTWVLRYPWYPDRRSLTIQHAFEPVTLDEISDESSGTSAAEDESATCELRLHVQHTSSGRRIDAVVPPDHFHTIVFPDNSERIDLSTGGQEARADLILTPGSLTHELTVPLTDLENTAWSGTRVIDDTSETYPRIRPDETRDQIRSWAGTELEIRINERITTSTVDQIEFLTSVGEIIADGDAVPLVGTRVGIRTWHPTPTAANSFSASWKNGLGALQSLTLGVTTAAGSLSRMVFICDQDSVEAECPTVVYHWNRFTDGVPSIVAQHSPQTDEQTARALWKDRWLGIPDRRMLSAGAILAVLAGIGVFFNRRHQSRRSFVWRFLPVACGIGIAAIVAVETWKHGPSAAIPDAQGLQHEVNRMLTKIYSSTTRSTEESIVDDLSTVLTDDMTEQLYAQISGSVLNPSRGRSVDPD